MTPARTTLHALLALAALALLGAGPATAATTPAPQAPRQMSTAALEFGDLGAFGLPRPHEGAEQTDGDVQGADKREKGRRRPTKVKGLGRIATYPAGRHALLRASRVATQVAGTFDGPNFYDSYAFPPDSMGDVGPTQFLVGINGRLRSYSKSTLAADGGIDVDFDAFWGLSSPAFSSDPRVRFDRRANRWVIVMIDVPDGAGNVENNVHIAVSDGPTISASTVWTFHTFQSETGEFLDYPTLGIDKDALYIGGLGFSLSSNFQTSRAYVIPKSVAYDGTTAEALSPAPTAFATSDSSTTTGGAFLPQGVDARDDSGNGHGYFVGVDVDTFGTIDVVPVNDPGGTPSLGTTTQVAVPTTAYPLPVPHKGNTSAAPAGDLDSIDDRLYNATLRDGHLYAAHSIGVQSDGTAAFDSVGNSLADRDASRWYDIDVSGATPTLHQSGTLYDPSASNPKFFWFPSVGVNGQDTLALGGSVAGNALTPNAWTSGRLSSDPLGTIDAPTQYTSSTATYNPPSDSPSSGTRRWGDYSFVGVDPEDDQTFWTIQEYARSTNVWGVKIAKVLAEAPATPAALSAPYGSAGTVVTISGSGGAWFDPGAGYPDHLAVSDSCGVGVSGVTVVSPTQLHATLDTRNASAATCDLTVTNPDGQAGTGAGALTIAGFPAPAPQPTTTTATTTPAPVISTTPTDTTPVPPPPPAQCKVPKLRNLTLTAAKKALTKAHCKLGKVRRAKAHGVRRGHVVAGSKKTGQTLPANTKINLTLRR